MHADLWKKVETLYCAALAQRPEERAAFLRKTCSDDPQLLAEVESLLDHQDESFLESAPVSFRPPLIAGDRLGEFEIVELLGRGGIGEVWQARDPRLRRDVAIKVLRVDVTTDPGQTALLEREARAASALNHPNVVAVYDIGRQKDTYWIASELVKGETLRRVIDAGTIGLVKAIDIATQIAEGLAGAHAAGLVHRDIKPDNIMVSREGRAKILDFGIATNHRSPADSTARGLTERALVGTPGYMSPEQIRGEPADHRSDLFSFGLILYEMLCSERPFSGTSSSEVMAAILNRETPPLPASVLAVLSHIVRRCLEKGPDQRFQSAVDLAFALRMASLEMISVTAKFGPEQNLGRGIPRGAWWIAALAMAAAVAFAATWSKDGSGAKPAMMQLTIAPPQADAFFISGLGGGMAISPDGRSLAYVAGFKDNRSMLYVRALDSLDSHPVPASQQAHSPFWSPDGQSVAFTTNSELVRVYLASGVRQTIADQHWFDTTGSAMGGTWNRDGVVLCSDLATGINRVPSSGGVPTPVFSPELSSLDQIEAWPQFLPDDDRFLFHAIAKSDGSGAVYAGSLRDPRHRTKIIDSGSKAVFVPGRSSTDGWLLFIRDASLYAQSFDPKSLRLRGAPIGIGTKPNISYLGFTEISATSDILVYAEDIVGRARLTVLDRQGTPTSQVGNPGHYGEMRFSPDGHMLAAMRDNDLWIIDLARGTNTRLTFSGINRTAAWSKDGTEIAWYRQGKGIYRASTTGGPEVLIHSGNMGWVDSWAPDNSKLLYYENTQPNLMLLPLTAQNKPIEPYALPIPGSSTGEFSPDGKWVAYASRESGSPQVFIQPFPPTGRKWQITPLGGARVRWRADARELFYEMAGKIMSVDIHIAGHSLTAAQPRELFAVTGSWDVSPDGQRFVTASGNPWNAPARPVVKLSWTAAFRNQTIRK